MSNAKEYLRQVALIDRKVDAKCDEIAQLRAMVLRITPTLKDDMVSGGSSQDKLGNTMAKIIDLQAEINADIDSLVAAKRAVGHVLDRLDDDRQYDILHKRYIQYKSWEQIAAEMHYTYRWVCIMHGRALKSVDTILQKENII